MSQMPANSVDNNIALSDEDFNDLTAVESAVAVPEFSVDAPHWRISYTDLLRILDIVSKFPSSASVYLALRIIKETEDYFIEVMASNKDYYTRCLLPVLNKENIFVHEKVYFIPDKTLATLVRAYTDFVFLFDESTNIYFYNSYVKHKLDSYMFNIKDFQLPLPDKGNYSPFSLKKSVLTSIKRLTSISTRVSDSKLSFRANKVFGSFMLYGFNFELPFTAKEPFFLRRTDLDVLSSIYAYDKVEYALDAKRVWVKFPVGELSFLRIPYDLSMGSKSLISEEILGNLFIDLSLFKKALAVVSAMGAKVITLSSQDGSVFVQFKDDSRFKIGKGTLSQEFGVSLDVLRKLVAYLPEVAPVMEVKVSSTGLQLVITDEDLKYLLEVSRISSVIAGRNLRVENKNKDFAAIKGSLEDKGTLRKDFGIEKSMAERAGVKSPE